MNTLGLRLIAHPLLADMKFAKLKLRPDVPLSDDFRRRFDAWLLDVFGTEERAFILPSVGIAYLSPKHMAAIRTMPRSAVQDK